MLTQAVLVLCVRVRVCQGPSVSFVQASKVINTPLSFAPLPSLPPLQSQIQNYMHSFSMSGSRPARVGVPWEEVLWRVCDVEETIRSLGVPADLLQDMLGKAPTMLFPMFNDVFVMFNVDALEWLHTFLSARLPDSLVSSTALPHLPSLRSLRPLPVSLPMVSEPDL
jgi:hypothetical protein